MSPLSSFFLASQTLPSTLLHSLYICRPLQLRGLSSVTHRTISPLSPTATHSPHHGQRGLVTSLLSPH